MICSSPLCCSFKEWQLKAELIHTAEGQFCTMQLSHTTGVFHCVGRDVFVSCNGAEQACSFPHNSLDKMCTFFFSPALGQSVSPRKLRHGGLLPKLIYKLFFTHPFPRSISSTTHGLRTASTHQSGIRSSNLSAEVQQLTAPVLLVHNDAKRSKFT